VIPRATPTAQMKAKIALKTSNMTASWMGGTYVRVGAPVIPIVASCSDNLVAAMGAVVRKSEEVQTGEPSLKLGASIFLFLSTSALITIPCVWQPQIGIGDFPSHIYNAWLATLIEQGKLPGMTLAHLKTNVLADLALVWLLEHFSVATAERVVLGGSVLIFVWGAFLLARAVRGRAPWQIAPILAVIAYGVIFQLGFSNFYLSCGICCFALALLWAEMRWWKVALAAALFAIAWKAHPLPVGWALGSLSFAWIIRRVSERSSLRVFSIACAAVVCISIVLRFHFIGTWERPRLLMVFGPGQAALHGPLYAAVGLGMLAAWLVQFRQDARGSGWRRWLQQPEAQLYILAVIAGVCMPLTFRIGQSAIGVVTERLSLFAAIFGCLLLAKGTMRRSGQISAAMLGLLFFILLFFDAREFNRLEQKLEGMVAQLPSESRVAALIKFPETRLQSATAAMVNQSSALSGIAAIFYDPGFGVNIHHIIDRVCINRCISYANYEPATYQFQVRAMPGTKFALLEGSQSGDMQTGSYRVRERDLPLYQIYPCGPSAFDLCGRWLRAGEINGADNYQPK